ncbi:MAG: His/Gly/Thr/Pro-type tRNA ligase C-terminal domain-containing protein [bacterium]|nr:His/Gly/Thr/Pro-type tRNA ligase C-terminal domain-containing protein [bacterium]
MSTIQTKTRVEESRHTYGGDFLRYGHDIALHYGFEPIASPKISREDHFLVRDPKDITKTKIARTFPEGDNRRPRSLFLPERKAALLRHVQNGLNGKFELPLMVHHFTEHYHKEKGPRTSLHLDIIGTSQSVAEAILIKTSIEILKEAGYKNLGIHVNSVGDRESMNRFSRELGMYYRRQLGELPAACRELCKSDVFSLLECPHDKCSIIREDAPRALSFLTEKSRQHFKEVLEHLEVFDLPYKISNYLVGNRALSCEALFEIREITDLSEEILAFGTRYDYFSRKLGLKREMPGVGIEISLPGECAKHIRKLSRPVKPKLYFVHLGFEAKLRGLPVLEELRQSDIQITHALIQEKLSPQLALAEKSKARHILIMGHKEAMEGTIIVRDMASREQDTVPVGSLVSYLRQVM